METKIFYRILPLLLVLCACQSEAPQESTVPKRIIRVVGSLPGSEDTRGYIAFGNSEYNTRAQITYDNPDPDKEIFMWDRAGYGGLTNNDYIALFNVSRLSQCQPEGLQLDVIEINGRSAVFESVESVDSNFEIKAGDTIFVNYGATRVKYGPDSISYDDRKIFTIDVGTESNKPQYIVNNPGDESLAYMHHNLRLYDIVKVVEDNKIPDLHFKHLSAIMRVTLRNATGKYLYPTKLEFNYPSTTGTESFFNTTLYCSVTGNDTDGFDLKVYEDDTFFIKGSKPYTSNIGTTINGKDGTTDAGDSIPNGKSYELYLSTVPRIGNNSHGDKLTISLIISHDTDHPYQITLEDFKNPVDSSKVIFTAGKRYWFDLTAVGDHKAGTQQLMLTSEWKKLHPDEKAPGE